MKKVSYYTTWMKLATRHAYERSLEKNALVYAHNISLKGDGEPKEYVEAWYVSRPVLSRLFYIEFGLYLRSESVEVNGERYKRFYLMESDGGVFRMNIKDTPSGQKTNYFTLGLEAFGKLENEGFDIRFDVYSAEEEEAARELLEVTKNRRAKTDA